MKTIVLGYDDSLGAKRALDRTAELARVFHSKVVVVSVAPVLSPAAHGIGPLDPADPPELHEGMLERAKQLLAERDVAADYELMIGNPARSIVELADRYRADLIVVGHEGGFLGHVLGISVSEGVERRAHCDVLVVH